MDLTENYLNDARSTVYDLGNSMLYDLCENNFEHTSPPRCVSPRNVRKYLLHNKSSIKIYCRKAGG